MKIKQLKELLERNNIPSTATIMGDSGWEVNATDIKAVYYDEDNNVLIFKQDIDFDFGEITYYRTSPNGRIIEAKLLK